MRIGQTSAIQFASKMITSAGGFLATLYFARKIGTEILGIYFLLLSLVGWITVLVNAGISPAITKRMSEGEEPEEYFQIGLAIVTIGVGVITLSLLVSSRWVTEYITHPQSTYFLIVLVGSGGIVTVVRSGLAGSRNVHISGILTTIQSILRIIIQVGAVSIGFGLSGLVFGWVLSSIAISLLGLVYLMTDLEKFPTTDLTNISGKVGSIYSFAKYSWLGSLKAKTNNHADILILGLFVPSNLIGVYSVAWNIASFLTILGSAIETTLFPEFSQLESQDDYEEITELLKKSLQYTGLFIIPGLFGGALLGERILKLYGPDFTVGFQVLVPLIIAVLIYDYQKQLTSVLQGVDRPDIDFRVNGVFIGSNIVLNIILIQLLGWFGAAIATALSSFISLIYAYYAVSTIITVKIPFYEIGKQVVASMVMSGVVIILKTVESHYSLIEYNAVLVFGLVTIGSTIYMLVLMAISQDTRETVVNNLLV